MHVGCALNRLDLAVGSVAHAHGHHLRLPPAIALDAVQPGICRVQAAGPFHPLCDDHLLARIRIVPDDLRARFVRRLAIARPVAVEEPVVVVGPARIDSSVHAPIFARRQIDDVHLGRRFAAGAFVSSPVGIARVPPIAAPALDVVVVPLIADGGVMGQAPDAQVVGAGLLAYELVDLGVSLRGHSQRDPQYRPGQYSPVPAVPHHGSSSFSG